MLGWVLSDGFLALLDKKVGVGHNLAVVDLLLESRRKRRVLVEELGVELQSAVDVLGPLKYFFGARVFDLDAD